MEEYHVINEVTLVERVQAGDEAAFELLYHLYVDKAVRVAFLITRSQQTAEDVVQETFIQVLRRIHTLRDPRSFRSWFFATLHNAARHSGRKGRGWSFFPFDLLGRGEPEPTVAETVDEVVGERQEAEEIRRLLGDLPEQHREAIVLRYYAELTEPEMAQVLGLPVGTVKSRLHTARQRLQSMLQAAPANDRRAYHAK